MPGQDGTVPAVSLLAWVFVGLVAGAIGQRVTGSEKRGCLGTLAVGVLGAFIGGGLYRALRGDEVELFDEVDLLSILVAVLGAIGLLLVLDAVAGRGRSRR
jgi:uncharacterized membrane protein YeaQ/YmgE (transglycosylase-associated protein family)